LCSILLAGVFLGVLSALAAEPLFQTSFEDGTAGGLPAGWTVYACESPNRLELLGTAAHSGKLGLHLVDASRTLACGLRSPRIPVKPDTDYAATWWFRAPAGSSGSLYIEFWDQEGKRIQEGGVFSFGGKASDRWEQMLSSATSPANAVQATLLASCWTGGEADAWYDDLAFVEGFVSTYDRTPLPPAVVRHPCGLYREADIERAKENLRRHAWAQGTLANFRKAAEFWMQVPDADLPLWIPELTPNRTLFCPKCDANWDYAWKGLPDLRIECTRCGLVLPSADYPENGRETLVDPLGRKVEYRYYEGAKGRRYRIGGRLRYERIAKLSSLGALGKVYALTGEKGYAEKAVKVLRRIAEVYPGYVPHDWTRFYRDYSNLQSGKLSGWKLHDAGVFSQLALCYDLIYNSGCLTEADKGLIENGAFREAARLFTATSPRGCCINDGPSAMTCGAWLGVILGDHEAVRWASSPPDGFLGFVHKYFFRDGHWEDGSSSYESMALGPLYGAPEILQGYSDPPTYAGPDRFVGLDLRQDAVLRKIYTAQLHILLPDGTAPPINDSAAGSRFSAQHVETNYHWYPTEANRRLLAQVYGGSFAAGDEYALFRREPDARLDDVEPVNLAAASLVRPGLGLAILRAGTGPEAAALYLDYGPFCSGHGHPDKLNLIYYDNGAELITDQGYLGARHEFTPWNQATLCHNEVLIDGEPQARKDGRLLVFAAGGPIQTIVAAAPAVYAQATRYERTVSLVDHGPGRRYVVDVFRVAGGALHDFAIHGAGAEFAGPALAWEAFAGAVVSAPAGARWVRQAQAAETAEALQMSWTEGGKGVRLDMLGQPRSTLFHLTAPGLRDRKKPWEKRELHVAMVRRHGPTNTFVSVIQPAYADGVRFTVSPEVVTGEQGEAQAVRVRGAEIDDLVVTGEAASAAGLTQCGELRFRGQQAFLSRTPAQTVLWLLNGTEAQAGKLALHALPPVAGRIVAVDAAAATVDTDAALPPGTAAGRLLIVADMTDGAYEIETVTALPGAGSRVKLAGEPVLGVKVGQEFAVSTWAQRTQRADGTVEAGGDALTE
jgi:hypothetical protein